MPAVEDRKRPALTAADDLPPSKRQAINGTGKMSSTKDSPAVEMREDSWIERFTKGAIYREMQEYSRKASLVESRLEVLHERSMHHDDHLRLIDAWWRQVLDEIALLAESTVPELPQSAESPFLSRVEFADLADFSEHLEGRTSSIRQKAEGLLVRLASSRGANVTTDIVEWESKVAGLLTVQKDLMLKLDALASEKERLDRELNAATLRYLKSEKRLDRTRSAQVQTLEQQAHANSSKSQKGEPGTETNGTNVETLAKYQEASAVAAKHKEQLEAALAEIKTLAEENSGLRVRREAPADDEAHRSDVVKHLRNQCDDLVKRINHMEVANRQTREECDKIASERTDLKSQLERDSNLITQDLETDITAKDQDLVRIRSQRDEMQLELVQRKASQDEQKRALDEMKAFMEEREHRIAALESAMQRAKPVDDVEMTGSDSCDDLTLDELRAKHRDLEQRYKLISSEIASMEQAYRKTSAIAKKKVVDLEETEQRMSVVVAEKAKADRRYYETQTSNIAKKAEIAALRMQTGRGSEIITQLKEVEAQNRTLLSNLEKQVVELKKANSGVVAEHRRMEAISVDAARRTDALRTEVTDLTNLVKSRDATAAALRERNVAQEAEVEKLRVRVDNLQKDRDNWKGKALNNSSEEEEMLRTFALCSVCRNNFKDTTLKTCGHLFCRSCVDRRIENRMRKCPTCSRAFDKLDVMGVHH